MESQDTKINEFCSKVESILNKKEYTRIYTNYNKTGIITIHFGSYYHSEQELQGHSDFYDMEFGDTSESASFCEENVTIMFGEKFIDKSMEEVLNLINSYPDDKPSKHCTSDTRPLFYVC